MPKHCAPEEVLQSSTLTGQCLKIRTLDLPRTFSQAGPMGMAASFNQSSWFLKGKASIVAALGH